MPLHRSPVDCQDEVSSRGVSIDQQLALLALQNTSAHFLGIEYRDRVWSSPYGNRFYFFKATAPCDMYYTEDRSSYTPTDDMDGGGDFTMYCVACSTSHVVAGGYQSVGPENDNCLRVSGDDGLTWGNYAIETGVDLTCLDIQYLDKHDLWFAITNEVTYRASGGDPRGNWAALTTDSPNQCRHLLVSEDPPILLAVGWSGKPGTGTNCKVSTDLGNTWTWHTTPFNTYSPHGGCYSKHHKAFFVPTSTGLYKTPDGITWELVDANAPNVAIQAVGGVLVRADGYVSLDGRWFTKALSIVGGTDVHVARSGAAVFNNTNDAAGVVSARLTVQTY